MRPISLEERARRLRFQLLVAISREPLADYKQICELFADWQQVVDQIKRAEARKRVRR